MASGLNCVLNATHFMSSKWTKLQRNMSNVARYYCYEKEVLLSMFIFSGKCKAYNFISLLEHIKNILRHVFKQLYISFLAPIIFGRSNQKLLPRIDTFSLN